MRTDNPDPAIYWLPRGVHAVAVDEDLVFLDTDRDAYFCLPGPTGLALSPDRRSLRAADGALALELCNAALMRSAPPQDAGPLPRTAESPIRSLVPLTTAPPAWRHVPTAVWAVAEALRHYCGKSLANILSAAGMVSSGRATAPSGSLRDVVEDFHRWIPYAPLSGKCLLRSFVLLRLLRRRGHDAVWVFGVRTWPFYAHCWLQCGDVVLDDDVERVAAFTPILAL